MHSSAMAVDCGSTVCAVLESRISSNAESWITSGFPWRCQACVESAPRCQSETETHQSAATCDGNVEPGDDGESEIADTVIGAPDFESMRLDTTFQYVLFR